jgi:hypothetical protein
MVQNGLAAPVIQPIRVITVITVLRRIVIKGSWRSAPILATNEADADEVAQRQHLGVDELVLPEIEWRLNDEWEPALVLQ